ncbi:MAG: hypothetical protein KKA10_04045 [Euryarchaeota archaeon]|nr:hypothetical protein [Euryarchaeota archaeon]
MDTAYACKRRKARRDRMLDMATGRIFICKRKGKLILHSKGRMGRLYDR